MRLLFAISLTAFLIASASANAPIVPTNKPSAKPTRAKYIYKTTPEEARANVAWSAVMGTIGFIAWQVSYYYKLKQDFVWSKRREHIEMRSAFPLPVSRGDDYSI